MCGAPWPQHAPLASSTLAAPTTPFQQRDAPSCEPITTLHQLVTQTHQGAFTGRLLRYTPSTGRTEVLVEGLWYANGVALGPGEEWVAVVETSRLRVMR